MIWLCLMASALAQSSGSSEADRAEKGGSPSSSRYALVDASVWDAVKGLREVDAVVIDGDRIVHVGEVPPDLPESQQIDVRGSTIIPGLFDMHVHLAMTPGGHFREDPVPGATLRHHLAAYVACGVTTVLDTGIPAASAREVRALERTSPSPEVHLLGPLVSPEGGYVSVVLPDLFEPAPDATAVRTQFAAFEDLAPFGVKATFEEGMLFKVWPLYSEEVRDAVFAEAETRDLGVYVHAMSANEYRLALEFDVAGFVHPTQSPRRKIVRELATRDLPVTSTLSVFDHGLIEFEPERLDRRLVQLTVPRDQLDDAVDSDLHAASKDIVLASVLPGEGGPFRAVFRSLLDKPGLIRGRLRRMMRSVAKQHRHGVRIALGSDSGNWPVFLTEFHGPTTLRELVLLETAGLTPEQALEAATYVPAQILGLEAEVGSIAPGMRADLVVVPGDILDSTEAIWDLSHVVRAGVLDTPQGWMQRLTEDP
jgi:imidazolonepropionase-like amidohydrolase